MAAGGEENKRPRPRWCSDGVMSGSNTKNNAMAMQLYRDEEEAKETQCSNNEDGAVVKQRNRTKDKAAVMQRSSGEDQPVVLQIRTRLRGGRATLVSTRPS